MKAKSTELPSVKQDLLGEQLQTIINLCSIALEIDRSDKKRLGSLLEQIITKAQDLYEY